MSFPAPLIPWIEQRFLKTTAAGLVPNDGGFVYFFEAGGFAVLQDTFSDEDLVTPNDNPIELDTDGRPPSGAIFFSPLSYNIRVEDSDGATLYTLENIGDAGWIALSTAGNVQTEGTSTSSTPYTVLSTDNLVMVTGSTDPFVVQLPQASQRGTALVIKNLSSGVVRVTPNGADTIDSLAAYYSIAAAASPLMRTITLVSDGVSAWWITGGIGV